MPNDPHRLDRTVVPRAYRIRIEPDLDSARFTVAVEIDVEASAPVELIELNSADLVIDSARVTLAGGEVLEASAVLDPQSERLTVGLGRPVAGPAVVELHATGELNDLLRGFYRSRFTDAEGRSHTIAATQFQATDARRMFPCWDEPDLKATFELTAVVAGGLCVVSNAPETGRRHLDDGRVEVRFAPTMVMSTYLVALVVGPLEVTEVARHGDVPINVVHVPGSAHLTAFAGECALSALAFFEDYYGIAYPSPKLDLVALPDFAMGAMENLGCVTFRESLLLIDPAQATPDEVRVSADVISHELAHMWFGDLVTMRWWNGIWLNEAFATFMEILAVDHFRPQWRRWQQFSLERGVAFDIDGLAATRPVEVEVRSPADASAMFDPLTYQKGGALLRMLEQYLGADRFRDGVRHYLARYSYANTETGDLWDAIEEVTGEPVRRMMDSWIFQPGHPLISAERDGDQLVLSQQRFSFGERVDPATWLVPVAVREGDGPARRVLLDAAPSSVALSDPTTPVVVNAGSEGFFRTRMDAGLRTRLVTEGLASTTGLERYCLLDDLWALVVSGAETVAEYLSTVRHFAGETELSVWQSIVGALSWCERFADQATRPGLAAMVGDLCHPTLTHLGVEPLDGEPDLDRQLRAVLWRTSVILGGDHSSLALARRLVDERGHDPGLTAAATTIVATFGSIEDHGRYVERFEHGDTPQEQLRFLYALAEFRDHDAFAATLELVAAGRVRSQNAPFLLARAMANPVRGPQAWEFVRDRWAELRTAVAPPIFVRMLEGLRSLTDPSTAADVARFFTGVDMGGDAQRTAQILERQRINVALHARSRPVLADLFAR